MASQEIELTRMKIGGQMKKRRRTKRIAISRMLRAISDRRMDQPVDRWTDRPTKKRLIKSRAHDWKRNYIKLRKEKESIQ